MRPLTESEIRRSLVNVDEAEAARLPLPGLHEVMWESREYLGWRDPSSRDRGYIVQWRGDRAVGIALRAAQSSMRAGAAAVCALCHTTQPANQVRLFSARRAGQAGREGNSVGTYICADLACSLIIRISAPATIVNPEAATTVEDRASGLETRLAAFIDRVLAA